MSLANDLALATVFTGAIYILTYIICGILLTVYPQLRIGNYVYVFMMGLIASISVMLIIYDKAFWKNVENDLAFIGMANIALFIGFIASALEGWEFSGVYGTLLVLVGLGALFYTGFIRVSGMQTQKVVKTPEKNKEEVEENG